MSDADESGDIKESSVEDENKFNIEEVNLDCVKNEPNEEALNFEEDCHTTGYRISLKYGNAFGEPLSQRKIEDSDNLIGFLDNVIMENSSIKLEAIKEDDDGSLNNIQCSKCKGIYNGYCLKCSTLLWILNNNSVFLSAKSDSDTIPTDILEIRETSQGKGVYLLRSIPTNIIFGPFEGILGIESTAGHSWKIIDNKLRNIKSGNWMKNIVCAASVTLKNLDIFQIDSNLYFRTNREITEGEELLIYYDDQELQQLDNSEECLYTPQQLDKLPKIFACTKCCLGFSSNKCLIEHKKKYCRMEQNKRMKDFVLIECHYCKMWMEKWEHDQYHVAYCLKKYHRMWSDRNHADVEEDDCNTNDVTRTNQRDICSIPCDGRDDLQFDTKDYQCLSGGNDETRLNECALAERSNNEQTQNIIETNDTSNFHRHLNECDICMMKFRFKEELEAHIKHKHADGGGLKSHKCSECSFQTNRKSHFQRHLNVHRGIKPFSCDVCQMKFSQKGNLAKHIKSQHTDDGNAKDHKCLECSYQTNDKGNFRRHLNKHKGLKFQCDICTVNFSHKECLAKHMKNKHTNDGSVKYHKCLECSFRTIYKDYLQKHINTHTGIRPFKCDICTAAFTQKGHLSSHIKFKHAVDRNAKCYQCLECSYKTNYKSNLQKHLNVHRGITFQCDICMVKYTDKGSLNKHIRSKHSNYGSAKNYKCLECSYQSDYKSNLQKHLNKHRGIKFQCDICMVKFTLKGNLTAHRKNKHTDGGNDKG